MAIVTTDDKHYKAIADAIREHGLGLAKEAYTPSEMADGVYDVWRVGENIGWNRGFGEGLGDGHAIGYDNGIINGKLSLLQASKYMNATVSGEVVAVKDVSPIEHDVAVRLSSDTLTNFSSVSVKRYGKNLCPSLMRSQTVSGVTFTRNEDGTITANGTATADITINILLDSCPTLPKGSRIYSSGCPTGGSASTYYMANSWIGAYDYGKGFISFLDNSATLTNWRKVFSICVKAGVTMADAVFKPQIEVNTQRTAYTPYIVPSTYTASADGTVAGVRSLSPSMSLVSDTDGVNITCSYLRDIDTYIDSLAGGA